MSLPQIRDEWRVPALLGARVTFRDLADMHQKGTIIGSWGDRVRVQPDNDDHTHLIHPSYLTFHPTTEEN